MIELSGGIKAQEPRETTGLLGSCDRPEDNNRRGHSQRGPAMGRCDMEADSAA